MSDPFEHSGMDSTADVASGLVLPEPLEHSVLVVPLEVGDGSVADITVLNPLEHSGVGVRVETVSAYEGGGPRDHQGEDISFPDPLKEVKWAQSEDGGGYCCRGCRLGGTLVSDGLGERYGS